MEITDVRLRMVENGGVLKAVATICIDDGFVVHDVKVIDSVNGIFVAMPSKQLQEGEFRDIAHPIRQSVREMIQNAVLDKYFVSVEEEKHEY